MPNGGPTPDCIHCAHFEGGVKGPWRCKHHQISLPYPIRAFCAAYVDPKPDENGDWLDQMLDRSTLQTDWMYVWLDYSFEHRLLVPLSQYHQWNSEDFIDALKRITDPDQQDDDRTD